MGSATLAALKGKMNTLILKKAPGTRIHGKPEDPRHKEPEYPTLNEHLWALVLQHLDNLQDRIKASACCRAAWKAALLKVKITIDVPAAGWQYVLRRGRTTTSLSVGGHESTSSTIRCAMKVLSSQGLDLCNLGTAFPKLEQISVGRSRRCLDYIYDPKWCVGDSSPFDTHTYFAELLANVKVVDMTAPMLRKHYTESRLFKETIASCSRLRHLTLMIDPMACYLDQPFRPALLNTSMAEIGQHSQLESLYIGLLHGFGCSKCGSELTRANPEDSIDFRLSHLQHLKSVHFDSFWPALLELPPGAVVHATFQSTPGQKHPGLWAGKAVDVQNLRLPFRSMHFLQGPYLSPEHAVTADALWPLKVKRSLEVIRVMASTLHLNLVEFPGLTQAERVLISASECHLRFPSNQVAHKHLRLRFSERLRLVISNVDIYAAQVNELTFSREDPKDTRPLSVLFLRNAMLAAGSELSVTSSAAVCQPEGRMKHWSYGWGLASLGVGFETMDTGEGAHAVRCCCHACVACLHRDGTAYFPEAIAEENMLFGV